MTSCDVSVILCTYNRASMLRLALDSLLQQHTQGLFRYEIIVVDDGSTDATSAVIAESSAQASVPVHYISTEGRGVAHARNRGIQEAHGRWIAFTDDDQINDAHWLFELVRLTEQQKTSCIGGNVELDYLVPPPLPLRPLVQNILGRKVHPEMQIHRLMDSPGTGNLMVHRSLFEQIGLFNENLLWGGEDLELMIRIHQAGLVVWFTPYAVVRHQIPAERMTLSYFRWTSLRVGIAMAEVDLQTRGLRALWFRCIARIAQAMFIHFPYYLYAGITHNDGMLLEKKCLLWRAQSYTRHTLHRWRTRFFSQPHFYEPLQFRKERCRIAENNKGGDRSR